MTAQKIVLRLLEAEEPYLTRLDRKALEVYGEGLSGVGGEVRVVWRLDEEHRSWGVKALRPIVERVTGYVLVEDENSEEQQIDLSAFTATFDWDDAERTMPPSIFPRRAEISMEDHIVKILF